MGSAMELDTQNFPRNFDVSAKAVICRGEQVLLLRRPNGRWDLPGGRVRVGEDAKQALLREVYEETGLTVAVLAQLSVVHRRRANGRDCLVVSFHCLFNRPSSDDMIALSCEHEDFAFVCFGKTSNLRLRPHHKKAIKDAWQLVGIAEAA